MIMISHIMGMTMKRIYHTYDFIMGMAMFLNLDLLGRGQQRKICRVVRRQTSAERQSYGHRQNSGERKS